MEYSFINSNDFLEICSKLELQPKFNMGERVCRGFADLGFEEFVVAGKNFIVSLFTGEKKEINESEKDHFFLIPDVDYLIQYLYELEVNIIEVKFVDEREWFVKGVSLSSDRSFESSESTLVGSLVALLNSFS